MTQSEEKMTQSEENEKKSEENKEEFVYCELFNVSAKNLKDYTESGYLVDAIIGYCAEDEFEVYSDDVYKALEEMIRKRGRDSKGVYSQEARDALNNLYRRYYEKYGKQKIELKDRPKNIFQRFYHSFKEAKDSLKAGVQKVFSPFSGLKNVFKKKKSVKAPQKKTKVFAFEKPRNLKYYLGVFAASAFLFLGLKGDVFSSGKKTQNEVKENNTEVKKNTSETSQSVQKKATLYIEGLIEKLRSVQPSDQQVKEETEQGQGTEIEPNPEPSNKTEKSSVKKQENKTQKSQVASRRQTQDSNGQKLSFHESRLNKFLGPQGAQKLCKEVESKCPQLTQEEINFVAYAYVINYKYGLGQNNPINQALSSPGSLTEDAQHGLIQYAAEEIGLGGEIARERATAKRLEREAKASSVSQKNKQEKTPTDSVSQDSVSQNAVSQSQSSFVSSDSISVSTQSVQVTTVSPVEKMTRAKKRALKRAEAKARKKEKKIQRAKEKEAKKRALEKKAAKEKAERIAQRIKEAKEAALRQAREQGKNFSLAQLKHLKENISRIS